MTKDKNESPMDWLKKMKAKGEKLLSKMTAEEIEEFKRASKDLTDRMHVEHFGCLPGEDPPEDVIPWGSGLEE